MSTDEIETQNELFHEENVPITNLLINVIESAADPGLLLEIIQHYELIYDLSNKDYKNNLKKQQALEEISKVVNMSVNDCMRLWKYMRDRFTREKRQKPSGSASSVSKWGYYDKMCFYNKYTKPRKTYTTTPKSKIEANVESRPVSSCSTTSMWSTVDTILSPRSTSEEDVDMEPEKQKGQVHGEHDEESLKSSNVEKLLLGKRKKQVQDDVKEVITIAKQIAATLVERTGAANDPNKRFVEYVYTRLQEMSAEQAQEK